MAENIPLYHYTSAAGLTGIFTSKKVWMTYIHSLNDSLEETHALSLIVDYLKERLDKVRRESDKFEKNLTPHQRNVRGTMMSSGYLEELSTLGNLIRQFENRDFPEYISNTFTFSLSESRDSLSQWRGYSSTGGYSIEFSDDKLKTLCDLKNCIIKKCVYNLTEQKRIIKEILDPFFGQKNEARPQEYGGSNFSRMYLGVLEQTSEIRPLFKHSSFSEEKEWRIILNRNNKQTQKLFPLFYRTNNEYITPYVELPLDEYVNSINGIKGINGIIVGPGIDFLRAQKSLAILARDPENLHCHIQNITQSESSYRL